MKTLQLKPLLPSSILFGIIGACIIIFLHSFPANQFIIPAYTIVLLTLLVYLKTNKKINVNYLNAVVSCFLVFMIISVCTSIWIHITDYEIIDHSFIGILNTLMIMVVIGILVSVFGALIFLVRKKRVN